ncbi:transcriptional regulator [Cupriavidus necator]|uniref:transcriptional regulator n=1 Tax=Cupriavidus necator TaxID=106590 RepID=UPI00339D5D39
MESDRPRESGIPAVQIQMLGPLRIRQHGVAVSLPASRKVRALLGYLALAPRPVSRSHLCELLWEMPNDPRGELRWCLSRIRKLVDSGDRQRLKTSADTIWLDLADGFVDALEIAHAFEAGVTALSPERQRSLAMLFEGDFLDGLELARCPVFSAWLTAQRRRLRACHTALLEHLATSAAGEETFGYLDKWRELAPFDQHVHATILATLARHGRLREGEEHVAATVKLFEAEGLDSRPIRNAWRAAVTATVVAFEDRAQVAGVNQVAQLGPAMPRHGSIAIMPFVDPSTQAYARGGAADALAHDVITRLAKLRSLFVIAQGTVYALHERHVGAEEAGRTLNVDYVVGGTVSTRNGRLTVTVELAETRSARIVWADTFHHKLDDAFLVLEEVGNRIVASVASEIETLERNRAILKPPSSLDAWEAYHCGLWHMYRYRREDNEMARHFFQTALRLDPTFSRAYAGLSFTHFQDAFQNWKQRDERGPKIDKAYDAAAQGLMVDDRDPAVHWAMGRALWLRGRPEESVAELEQSIDLSPNFALGHYNLSFVRSISGDPQAAIVSSDLSRQLSPFDPMLFGMLATRAMALVRLGRFDEAAGWAVKAAARPNAFPHIHAIAACCLALAGSLDQARAEAATIRKIAPAYSLADFLMSFPFDPEGEALFREGARRIGMG